MRCYLVLLLLTLLPNATQSAEIRLTVSEPSQIARPSWPVTSGVPLARGALRDPSHAALYDQAGNRLPLQTEALTRWPDGSIRWLLLDFPIDLQAGATARPVLHYGQETRQVEPTNPLKVVESPAGVTIHTGPLKVELNKRGFRLLDRVWLDRNNDGHFADAERITASEGAGIELTAPDGRVFRADLGSAEMRVEQTGPLRACVRIEGNHADETGKMFRYVVRLHAYRGQPFVRLDYTFINDHQPLWLTHVSSLELVFARDRGAGQQVALLEGKRTEPTRLFQVDDRQFKVNDEPIGKQAAGWAAVGGRTGGFAVGVRKFWQNWPKSLEVGQISSPSNDRNGSEVRSTPFQLRVGICPTFSEGLYDGKPIREEAKLYFYLRGGQHAFKIGVARTHELWATFYPVAPNGEQLTGFFQAVDQPLLAECDPEYVLATRAAGRIPPADPTKFLRYDAWLDNFFQLHLDDQAEVREYGYLNYGDWFNIDWDSWGNLEYDLARCCFAQYLRSGDRRYFDRAEQAARHFVDVDVAHAVNQQLREYGGSYNMDPGGIWAHSVGHTGGYYGRYVDGKYHDVAPLVMKDAYQLGLSNLGHVWIGGALDYYVLTGDRRALEVSVLASDAMARRCPTRYDDHIRGIGWPLNMMLDAYEGTGDKKYLAAASRQWAVLKEHLDLQKGWQIMLAYGHCPKQSTAERCRGQNAYMLGLTLSGVARYHRITQDPEVLAGLTAGVEQLIRECWDEETRSFYLSSCIHNRHNPPPEQSSVTFLASHALAYESELTGSREHRRILRDAMRTGINAGLRKVAAREQHGATGYASMLFRFTPYALYALEEE